MPRDWKHANVVAIFKKGSRSKPAIYRPVSLTSGPRKLLEHIIYRSIMIHLNSFHILVDAQHGFRPGRSRETQLINTVEHLARSVNDRNQTDLLILDFSKAFDKVAYKRLVQETKTRLHYTKVLEHNFNSRELHTRHIFLTTQQDRNWSLIFG